MASPVYFVTQGVVQVYLAELQLYKLPRGRKSERHINESGQVLAEWGSC